MQARTRTLDLLRSEYARSHRELRAFHYAEGPRSDDDYLKRLARMDIDRMLGLLPATHRAAIELAFFHDMPYRAVAVCLGLPERTVKSRIRSGLTRLRQLQSRTGYAWVA
jgi:RNA polymerase sigma-70 factor, ECF subfamily